MSEEIYKELLSILSNGESAALLTCLKPSDEVSGVVVSKYAIDRVNLIAETLTAVSSTVLNNGIDKAFQTGALQLIKAEAGTQLVEPFFPKPRLIILGGGHIAKPLSEFGAKVGFSIVIIDDRPSFASAARFPAASKIICDSFENSFELIEPRQTDFIVIVTRGHRYDELCLRKALTYKTAYLGMIGSMRRVKAMKELLLKDGCSQEALNRVNSPIGLDIGAVTPEEISIAIIAEAISYRRGHSSDKSIRFNLAEFDEDVINSLAGEAAGQRALVTIIASKGSVPRKTGAKMLVWQDGRTLGSIGGGCSEAAVVAAARDICGSKAYTIHRIDMTGEIAEDEGMVCGGIIEVLIEAL